MFSVSYAIGFFVIVVIVAFLDEQVERKKGKTDYGWAKYLDCWRPKNPNSFIPKIYSIIMEGKELTGYHIALFSLVFIVLHVPFFTGVSWDLIRELETLSMYFMVMLFEDFLYFVLNPDFGAKKFKPQYIPWHKNWIGPIPTDYPVGIGVSLGFALLAAIFWDINILGGWGVTLGIFIALTLLSILVSEIMRGRASA